MIGALGLDFGAGGDDGEGLDLAGILASLGDGADPNEFLAVLLDEVFEPLFTDGDDVVDLNDIDAILAVTGIPDLETLLALIGAGFNISDALAGNDTVILPEPGSPLFGLFDTSFADLLIYHSADVTGDGVADTVISIADNGEFLAILDGVNAPIDENDFVAVP